MAIILTEPPTIEAVWASYDPLADIPGVYVCVRTRGYAGLVPYEAEACELTVTEFLEEGFFSGHLHDDIFDAYDSNGITPGAFAFPPVAQDTTVWDPETNAPYP